MWRCRVAGRARTIGNRVYPKRVSRVRISPSPPKIPQSERTAGFLFCRLFVDFFPVGAAKEIVHADLIKVSQGTEYMRRDHPLSAFIISICPLGNIDCCSHLRLREVVIFPQVTDPVVLFHTHHQEKYKIEQFVLLTF